MYFLVSTCKLDHVVFVFSVPLISLNMIPSSQSHVCYCKHRISFFLRLNKFHYLCVYVRTYNGIIYIHSIKNGILHMYSIMYMYIYLYSYLPIYLGIYPSVYISHFLFPFIHLWIPRLMLFLNHCEWCYNKHGSTDVSFIYWFYFLWIYTWQWDCAITW
jgi:hypothetical protein